MLFKAHRFRDMPDAYNIAAPILKTVTRDLNSHRIREIKPGDEAESIYDVIHHPGTQFKIFNEDRQVLDKTPRYLFYNDVDALEDRVLFPEETHGPGDDKEIGGALNSLVALEEQGPDINRFVFDLDTDEEFPDRHFGRKEGESSEDDDFEDDDQDDEHDDNQDDWEDVEDDPDDHVDRELDLQKLVPSHTSAYDDMKTFVAYMARHHKPEQEDPNHDMMGQYQRFMKRESSKGTKIRIMIQVSH